VGVLHLSNTVIEVSQLTKKFKEKTSVDHANFKIMRGEIFGLIGKNGAGKSTLLKMIGGLIHPTSGEIYFFDRAEKRGQSFFERMGLLIENPGLYPGYTAYETLELVALSYGLKGRKKEIHDLLKLVGLDDSNKTKVKNYSMGMKQRLGIAIALLGSPDVLILDEPINGLDPQGIVEIRKLILDLNQTGLTIIISSHILEELSKIANKYAIIHEGKIIELISKDELLLKCEERIELVIDRADEVLPVLEQQLDIMNYKVVNQNNVHIYDTHVSNHQIVKVLVENDISVHTITMYKMSLEEYFLERTGTEV